MKLPAKASVFSPLGSLVIGAGLKPPSSTGLASSAALMELEVIYQLRVNDKKLFSLNALLGHSLRLEYQNLRYCLACGRRIKKSFSNGACYPCFISLARLDLCAVKPETCHYHTGTCREAQWGERHCFVPHVLYLAYTSQFKVGVTRSYRQFERWMEQGALLALPFALAPDRLTAGKAEVLLKAHFSDKTYWRALLKAPARLAAKECDSLCEQLLEHKKKAQRLLQTEATLCDKLSFQLDDPIYAFHYPILQELKEPLRTLELLKTPTFEARLVGLRGHYLLFEKAVFNVRKFSSCVVSLSMLS